MATTKRDYYEVLAVERDVTAEDLKRSYRKLAVKFHPDKNPGDARAEEQFKELGEAYDILSDPTKRAAYDRYGHADGAGGIFEQFFGGATRGTDREGRQRGSDLRYDMQITLEEAAVGIEKEIEIKKLTACEVCHGSGAEAGSHAITCRTCQGRGQVITSRGFFQVSQTCPRCRGTGSIIENPC
jgi:molecular chaperone DnaJ